MTVWLVGGIDPTGGAGLLRDFWAARLLTPTLEARCAVTAFTWQGRIGAARARPVESGRLRERLAKLPSPSAVKLGLVPDPCLDEVCEALARADAPIVVDPVLHASDGGALGASASGVSRLANLGTLVTPNLPEAAALTGLEEDDPSLPESVASLLAPTAVLLKGGHARDSVRVVDRLCSGGHVSLFERPRRPGPEVRGTGCALATAITCALAGGAPLETAVRQSIAWLDEQREHCHMGPDGRLHLPT